jgi:ketosteroid isomerase-like protein
MDPAELHERVRDGVNAGDVDALVALYEPAAVLMAEDGTHGVGLDRFARRTRQRCRSGEP